MVNRFFSLVWYTTIALVFITSVYGLSKCFQSEWIYHLGLAFLFGGIMMRVEYIDYKIDYKQNKDNKEQGITKRKLKL